MHDLAMALLTSDNELGSYAYESSQQELSHVVNEFDCHIARPSPTHLHYSSSALNVALLLLDSF